MKILWVVSFVLPEVADSFGNQNVIFGGWVSAMIRQLSRVPSIELGVAMKANVDTCTSKKIGNIQYYFVPQSKYNQFDVAVEDCEFVLSDFKPDLLHVEGSESAHALRFLNSWNGNNVVSMQGIINGYEPYEYGGLPVGEMLASFSWTSTMVATVLILNKWINFNPRLSLEVETIQKAKNILGRTHWDQAHAYAINPEARYFNCNRILRDSFYKSRWDLKDIQRRSLFIGNGASPRKGAHFVFHAVAQLKAEYPDVKLYLAGDQPFCSSWKDWKTAIGYKAYLRYLIRKLDIADHVEFTGVLQADQMAKQLLNTHVYIMSSVIENSPNTLGEAMILGVPCVTTYAGGTPDMAADGEEALFYRPDDPAMLALQVRRIFEDDDLAERLSQAARARARLTHDPERNLQDLIDAYLAIMTDGKKAT
ncbi:MAG: glycosyltransferase family 4 protein [Pseudomonadales bacterium]|nr:glycosyltransferase family 4 protein [Pseudomonadales bacterium]